MAKFLINPFATAGDKTAIPDAADPSGFVSWEEGYPIDYSRPYDSDPLAKPIERLKLNQALYDISSGVQQYQTHGVPDFITSADNGGVPYPYDYGAIVRYDAGGGFKTYRNIVAGNTNAPDVSGWEELRPASETVAINTIISTTPQPGIDKILNCNMATGTITISDGLEVGARILVRKIHATQGAINISFSGAEVCTRKSKTSIPLNRFGDNWLIEKVSATQWEIISGFASGSNANGTYNLYQDLSSRIAGTVSVVTSSSGSNIYGSTSGSIFFGSTTATFPISSDIDFKILPSAKQNVTGAPIIVGIRDNLDLKTQVSIIAAYPSSTTIVVDYTGEGEW